MLSTASLDRVPGSVLAALNRTAREFPRGRSLAELVEAQAALTPRVDAVQDAQRRLTYAELEQRASAIAAGLAAAGAGPGGFVGVCLQRSVETVAALLGVLKTGAAYIPLDPAYPAARLALMVEDAGCDLVLTERAASAFAPQTARRLVLGEIPERSEVFVSRAGADDLA